MAATSALNRALVRIRPPLRAPEDAGFRVWLGISLLLVLLVIATPRLAQWWAWIGAPERHFAGEVVVASIDSYGMLHAARQMREGVWDAPLPDPMRRYPDGVSRERISLLPRLIALGADLTGATLYRAGMVISLVFSVLFAIPLVFFFARCGMAPAGLVGAAVGGLSHSYLQRTSVYRVDTDGGNLLFVWLVSWALLATLQAVTTRARLGFAALSGICCLGFVTWYAQPGFAWVFGGTLALSLLLTRPGWRSGLGVLGVFMLCTGPWALLEGARDIADFVRGYLLDQAASAGPLASFPNVLSEIHELRRLPLDEALALLQRPWPLALLGLLGLAVAATRLRGAFVLLLPSLLLGGLGLVESMRFLMYLAPLCGVGLGALLGVALTRTPVSRGGHLVAAFALVALLLPGSAAFEAPRPRVDVDLLRALLRLREEAPPGSVALAPWSEGYPILDVARLATFGDGQAPHPLVEHLVALAFASPEPIAFGAVGSWLASHGEEERLAALEQVGDPPALVPLMAGFPRASPVPIVVVLTERMRETYSWIFRKAIWDFEARRGRRAGYDVRHCVSEGEGRLRCSKPGRVDVEIDVEAGTLVGNPIARFLRLREGEVVEDRTYGHRGAVLQLLESPTGPHVLHILDEVVFASNFNQMYVLGRYDAAWFEPLVTSVGTLRAYRLRDPSAKPASASGVADS